MTQPALTHLDTPDGHRIGVRLWQASAPAQGVLHWMHGMAEHGGRYGPLAEAVNAAGWHLCVHDHRGHGESVSDVSPQGHFGDQGGWQQLLGDITQVQQYLRDSFPALPHVLAGHSMGSFAALAWAERHANMLALDGLILCGSDHSPSWIFRLGRLPVLLEKMLRGPRGASALMRKLTFGSWARQVPDRKTDFDWLSAEPAHVQQYLNDPQCGHDCTTQLWLDLLGGLAASHSKAAMRQLPPQLPILLIAGDSDPMSRCGKGVPALARALKAAGNQSVTLREYPGGRHEILNDCCRAQVHRDLIRWLQPLMQGSAQR